MSLSARTYCGSSALLARIAPRVLTPKGRSASISDFSTAKVLIPAGALVKVHHIVFTGANFTRTFTFRSVGGGTTYFVIRTGQSRQFVLPAFTCPADGLEVIASAAAVAASATVFYESPGP